MTRTPDTWQNMAVVHEWFSTYAGSERVVEQLLAVDPRAELYGLVDFLSDEQRGWLGQRQVHTSWMQRWPLARRFFRHYLPLMPLAVEQFDLTQFDLVVSSSHAVAKGVLTRPDQLHVCYTHTPLRYAWDLHFEYLQGAGLSRGVRSLLTRIVLHYLRLWDRAAADRVDLFVANSRYVAQRIRKTYRRRAQVVYPPVDVERYTPGSQREDFYLTASRLVPYKRVDLIVEAFRRRPELKLVVIGDGPEAIRLARDCPPNVELRGHCSHDQLCRAMQQAQAFLFAAEEDFGITPVEAQACGTPVIALGRGGALETVVRGRTGFFFAEQTVPELLAAVEEFESRRHLLSADEIRLQAERFGVDRFRAAMTDLLTRAWRRHRRRLETAGTTTLGSDVHSSTATSHSRRRSTLPR